MKLDTIARLPAGALLMTSMSAVSLPAPALAQRPMPVVTVPCCRCLDGRPLKVDISTGNAPWMVAPPVGVTTAAVPVASPPLAWTTALAPAKWVNHPTAGMAVGFYSYTLRIVVPKCTIPARVTLAGRLATDNQGTLILGSSTPALNVSSPSFTTPTPFGITTLGSGTHIITVRVRNNELQTGLVLNGAVTVRCPNEPEEVGSTGHETGRDVES